MQFEKTADASEALKKGNLDWEVAKLPTYLADGTESGAFVVMRKDTSAILGHHGERYETLQNKTLAQLGQSLVGETGNYFSGAGEFKGGKKVFLQVKMPGVIRTTKEDITEKFLLLASSHDGSLPISVLFTPIRVVCQNTLKLALGSNEIRAIVRHTTNMMAALDNVAEIIGLANKKANLLEQLSQRLISLPAPSNFKEYVIKSGIVASDDSTRAKNIMEDVSRLFETGKGTDLPGVRGTAWNAYNAVVEYVDHYMGREDNRTDNALFGRGANIKMRAADLLLA